MPRRTPKQEPHDPDTEELDTLEGSVTAVIFHNDENGYSVVRLKSNGEQVTAVGIMPGICSGIQVELQGAWINHPTYGSQFRADHMEQRLPTETDSIFDYLSTGVVKGIGPKLAQRLVDRFGARTFEVLESEPEELAKMKGISLKKARAIQAEFAQRAGMRTLLEFLAAHSMPPELGVKLWKQYGKGAIEIVRSDPYVLVDEELGIRFGEADRMAASLGVRVEDPQRIEAGLYYVLTHNLDLGHVFLPEEKLMAAAAQLLSTEDTPVGAQTLREGLDALELRNQIQREDIAGVHAVYRGDLYDAEVEVAERIGEMCQRELMPPKNVAQIIDRIQREQGIEYAAQQREAVALAARVQVMLLTGGPGTGKTTSLRGILELFDALHLDTALAAPTGRAAKRLSELCGTEATTIHRLLEAGYDSESGKLAFTKCPDEPLDVDAVIVDEMSMVDVPLMAALLGALKSDCRLVLVGDPDQLPSVGPGQLFDHLIRSGVVPMVRLTEIFRQAQQSAIVMNAHMVNQGELPTLVNHSAQDFFFLRRVDGPSAVDTILDLCARRLPEKLGIPADQIQVLSPTRKYITGTTNLNQSLQQVLNPPAPGKKERKFGSMVFREGDRVIQVRNNYDIMWREEGGRKGGMGIFNGDIGEIVSIEDRGELLTVNFEGRLVEYTADLLPELELAYAMTVHKAQGSEYRAVILAACGGAPMLMTRGVLYTAITRAKDLLIIVGRDEIIYKMVGNDRQTRRYSGLRARLAEPS
ncbi:MAG: ATP-dependent RecD-like DNA helicase [Oscillospiraceae bacterium]|nr:ATP-dependent RecD-like DNA helicase [Oscillospiraceae bacterium]